MRTCTDIIINNIKIENKNKAEENEERNKRHNKQCITLLKLRSLFRFIPSLTESVYLFLTLYFHFMAWNCPAWLNLNGVLPSLSVVIVGPVKSPKHCELFEKTNKRIKRNLQ